MRVDVMSWILSCKLRRYAWQATVDVMLSWFAAGGCRRRDCPWIYRREEERMTSNRTRPVV